ncbi:TonB-dependent receptor domain-containing protein [Aquirufa ecclesiirivi]|uniref:TonB-dependent receptor domain-containing protein n=1 Tax=Aquirufa ecclesiirivi TaxID=2715124 RepID=UPI00140D424E|nr:TonB-dependent receptor [Aquirufa ecclesiirivi]NHC48865.1 TonB-dependent receptor [Aquirufa ecclesiirivi]
MIQSKVFKTVVFCLVGFGLMAQYSISGKIHARKAGIPISGCQVFLNQGNPMTQSNEKGEFQFKNLPKGSFVLHTLAPNFQSIQQAISLQNKDITVDIYLDSLNVTLNEVVVTQKQTDFGFTRMRAVESMGIYEGKKTEVILPEQLVANLATNNARQVFSRVAGLNIWENDGAGLQLSIGGRGLDPNRTSNFNVRQNGYDISADALGYPESYYTPPIEAVGRIQIVRGAASLQYGTQFGGLINFVMKKPVQDKKLELVARQSAGSFGFYNAFTSVSGTQNKLSYYTFFQYKRADGWRANSDFESYNFYADVDYRFSDKTSVGIDITHMNYLAHQPGGLTEAMFAENPRQTNRERNWFKVNWNLWAVHLDHKFNPQNEVNLRLFGLSAYRKSVGFRPNRVASVDDNSERDLITGDFSNWGAEARYLKRYFIGEKLIVFLAGSRFYHGFNHSIQGLGSKGKSADFDFINTKEGIANDYKFPNNNTSLFFENIFYLSDKFSITPGLRWEYIHTRADGFYGNIQFDLAGNIISATRTNESRTNERSFVLGGVGFSYKPKAHLEAYSNVSQNYRSITFSDMRIANPSSVIDPDMKDEKGYSVDLGLRTYETTIYNFDISAFYLNYNNRIGEVQFYDANNRVLRRRSNIGQAVIMGIESYGEVDVLRWALPEEQESSAVIFANLAFIQSEYKASQIAGIVGKQVEFVPNVNMKTGLRIGNKKWKASFQYTYLSDQYTEATNAKDGGVSAVVGLIPAYNIMDAGISYQFSRFKIEGNINNLANSMYFTRRATGYPGPGILPSDGRSFYLTVQAKF